MQDQDRNFWISPKDGASKNFRVAIIFFRPKLRRLVRLLYHEVGFTQYRPVPLVARRSVRIHGKPIGVSAVGVQQWNRAVFFRMALNEKCNINSSKIYLTACVFHMYSPNRSDVTDVIGFGESKIERNQFGGVLPRRVFDVKELR